MPPSQQSAEYIAARDLRGDQGAGGILASLSPQQLAFLQCVGSALAAAAGGAVKAQWLPAWAAQSTPAPAPATSSTWGALHTSDAVSGDAWMPRCRAAVTALGALGSAAQVQLPLGTAVDMLQKSVANAQGSISLLRCVVALVTALARQPHVPLDQHLHRLLPSVLSALLSAPPLNTPQQADEAFATKDAAGRLINLLLQRYGDVYASLRPRLEAVLKRPLQALAPTQQPTAEAKPSALHLGTGKKDSTPAQVPRPPVLVLYGAVQAMVALGSASVTSEVLPVRSQLQDAAAAASKEAAGPMQQAVAEFSSSMLAFALQCAEAAVDGKQWVERPQAPAPAPQPAALAASMDAPSSGMSLYGSHAASSTAVAAVSQAPAQSMPAAAAPASAPMASAAPVAAVPTPTNAATGAAADTVAASSAGSGSAAQPVTAAAKAPVAPAPAADEDEEDVEFDL